MPKRMDLSFNFNKEEEQLAYSFLAKLTRSKSSFVSHLVCNFIHENNIEKFDELPADIIKDLVSSCLHSEKEPSSILYLLNKVSELEKKLLEVPPEEKCFTVKHLNDNKNTENESKGYLHNSNKPSNHSEEIIELDTESETEPFDDEEDDYEIENDLLNQIALFRN